jgi:hypothetical protein
MFNKDVVGLEEQIKSSSTHSLSYSCWHWIEHLGEVTNMVGLHQKLLDFLSPRLLFWMEVLNLEQQMVMGPGILHQAQNCLATTNVSE